MDLTASDTPKLGDMNVSTTSFEITEVVLLELVRYLSNLHDVTNQEKAGELARVIKFKDACMHADTSAVPSDVKDWYHQQGLRNTICDVSKANESILDSDGIKILVKQLCEAALTLPLEKMGMDPVVKHIQEKIGHLRKRCDHDLVFSRLRKNGGGARGSRD